MKNLVEGFNSIELEERFEMVTLMTSEEAAFCEINFN